MCPIIGDGVLYCTTWRTYLGDNHQFNNTCVYLGHLYIIKQVHVGGTLTTYSSEHMMLPILCGFLDATIRPELERSRRAKLNDKIYATIVVLCAFESLNYLGVGPSRSASLSLSLISFRGIRSNNIQITSSPFVFGAN